MFVSKYLVIFLILLVSAYGTLGHVLCNARTDFSNDADTPEDCAALCVPREDYGICYGWSISTSGSSCRTYFIDREAHSGSYEDCGINSEASVEVTTTENSAAGPASPPVGCSIRTYVQLGYSETAQACENACKQLESNTYRTCLAWLWDEDRSNCNGHLLQDSTSTTCGTP